MRLITQMTSELSGINLAASDYVMKIDGMRLEAILRQGDALDDYCHGLQDQVGRNQDLKKTQTGLDLEET